MVKATLEKRVEMLEETVDGADGVSARLGHVETEVREFRGEFLQFRDETRGEFSAVRGEMAAGFASVRSDMAAEFASVRGEMAAGFASVRSDMAAEFASVRAETATEFASVRAEMATKQDLAETRSQMRTLHEELIGRLALLQEGQDAARTGARRPRSKR